MPKSSSLQSLGCIVTIATVIFKSSFLDTTQETLCREAGTKLFTLLQENQVINNMIGMMIMIIMVVMIINIFFDVLGEEKRKPNLVWGHTLTQPPA